MTYKPFWKSEFQNCLTSVVGKGNIVWWDEVSDSIESSGIKIWEYVYRIKLKHPHVFILVFSSVYKNDDRSREVNSDAVKVVYEWRTENGVIYKKICKKYRVDTLFDNLQDALIAASNECFNLDNTQWNKSLEYSLSD